MVGEKTPNPEEDLTYDAIDESESEFEDDDEFWNDVRDMRDEY